MKIFVLRGLKNFFFAHKKIKIFRVGGKNRVGRVTPIKQFFLGLIGKGGKKETKQNKNNKTWLCPLQGHELS